MFVTPKSALNKEQKLQKLQVTYNNYSLCNTNLFHIEWLVPHSSVAGERIIFAVYIGKDFTTKTKILTNKNDLMHTTKPTKPPT